MKLAESRQLLMESIHELTIQFTERKTTLTRMVDQIPEELRTVEAYEFQVKQAIKTRKHLK